MHGHQEDVMVCGEAKEADAEERTSGEVEGLASFEGTDAIDFVGLVGSRMIRHVYQGNIE
jgi:hypothetical protein